VLCQILLRFSLLSRNRLPVLYLLGCNTHSRLTSVHLLLELLFVCLAFAHYLVNRLFEQHFKLSFLTYISIVLSSSLLKQSSFVFHLLAQRINNSLVSNDLFLLRFYFSCRLVKQRTSLRHKWLSRDTTVLHSHIWFCLSLFWNNVRLFNDFVKIYRFLITFLFSFGESLLEFFDILLHFLVFFFLQY